MSPKALIVSFSPCVNELVVLADVKMSDPEAEVVGAPEVQIRVAQSAVKASLRDNRRHDPESVHKGPAGVNSQSQRVNDRDKLKDRSLGLHVEGFSDRLEDNVGGDKIQQN